jgi:hypothetical protein
VTILVLRVGRRLTKYDHSHNRECDRKGSPFCFLFFFQDGFKKTKKKRDNESLECESVSATDSSQVLSPDK